MSGVARARSGTRVGHLGVVLDRRVDRRRADHDRVAVGADPAELVDAADVDEVVEVREPERDHRHEALTAGEHLGAVAELGEQRDRLVDARRARDSRTPRASSTTGPLVDHGAASQFRTPISSVTRSGAARTRRPWWMLDVVGDVAARDEDVGLLVDAHEGDGVRDEARRGRARTADA